MNLKFSYGSVQDKELSGQGYKFLGAGMDRHGVEVHVFETFPGSSTEAAKRSDLLDKDAQRYPYYVLPLVVPEGFRLLTEGERLRKGDVYCRGPGHSWHETHNWSGKWTSVGCWPMARKIKKGKGNP